MTSQRSLVRAQYRPPFEHNSNLEDRLPNEVCSPNLNEVLELLLSPSLKEQLRLRRLDNNTLFETYLNELRLRNLSPYYIKKVWELLRKFKDYLNGEQPTPLFAKTFLSQYINRKQNTVVRYFELTTKGL